ncbi:MAG TPA: PP0621 family protein [Geothermobacteraceae bacterium]|nr:PP0621 family protein [Geothermobacteraceae bacterium]
MIRLLLLVILGCVVYSVFVMLVRQVTGRKPPVPREKTSCGEEMVKDPQCGTYLPRSDALPGQVKGETRYFCSKECRDKYSR